MSIDENIKLYRKINRLTQKQLAEKLGITDSAITKYEKGEREPKIETLIKIAEVLNVPIEQLLSSPADEETIKKWDEEIDVEKLNEEASIIEHLKKASTKQLIEELNDRSDFPIELKIK